MSDQSRDNSSNNEKPAFKEKIKELFKFEPGRPKHLKSLLILFVIIVLIALGGVTATKRYSNYSTDAGQTSIFVKPKPKEKSVESRTVPAVLDGTQVTEELS